METPYIDRHAEKYPIPIDSNPERVSHIWKQAREDAQKYINMGTIAEWGFDRQGKGGFKVPQYVTENAANKIRTKWSMTDSEVLEYKFAFEAALKQGSQRDH